LNDRRPETEAAITAAELNEILGFVERKIRTWRGPWTGFFVPTPHSRT
jgi:hypothetical protein